MPQGSLLTQRRILLFWLPLAASWALMSLEGPFLQAVIARLPDMQTQLAAFGVVMSLEIAIESPVIMLLATSTALATNPHNYMVLRRFMIWANLLVTVVAVLAAFTPLYGLVVRGIMGVPPHIAAAAQPGMKIMTLWSAAIGFRRFLQGVLIRRGETRWVGYGTALRLVASGGCGLALALLTSLTGVAMASAGLMAGVVTEALYVAWAARPEVRKLLSQGEGPHAEYATFRDVTRYHAPLAATSLLTLLAQPLIGAGLARMPSPEENLAAWPVIWGMCFIFRSPAFALPEAVIALVSRPGAAIPLRRFCLRVGLACSGGMLLLVATPLFQPYLQHVAGLPERLAGFVIPGVVLAVAVPCVNAVHSWFRGLLMSGRRTDLIYRGMGLNLAATALLILLGILLRTPGAVTAVAALTFALLLEVWYLRARLPKSGIPSA